MAKVAIVILNYNTFEDTIVCVNSIKEHTKGVAYKIYVVDNASPDKSGCQLHAKYENDSDVMVLLSESNLGFSGGNNIGIRTAMKEGCSYIYLLNSDIILMNDAISIMQESLESSSTAVVVGPSVFDKEKHYMQYARNGISLATYISSQRSVLTLFPMLNKSLRYYTYDIAKDFSFTGMVSGCCFGIRADFVQRNNALDDNVFMYYEEDILAHLIKKTGKQSIIASNAHIIHNEGSSTKKSCSDRLLFTRFYRWTSVLYVLKKYANVNVVLCKVISFQNIFIWFLLSLIDKRYKQKFDDFVRENKKILKK